MKILVDPKGKKFLTQTDLDKFKLNIPVAKDFIIKSHADLDSANHRYLVLVTWWLS